MLQLLCKDDFPFKARKIAVIGESNSANTSWFAPFERIIGEGNVAQVVDEGRFAMQLVNEDTQCILMDEWATGKFFFTCGWQIFYRSGRC